MACIAVGIIRQMKDEAVFSEYRAVAAEALSKHGGTILIPPSPPTVLDGEDAPAAVVILEFPDRSPPRPGGTTQSLPQSMTNATPESTWTSLR